MDTQSGNYTNSVTPCDSLETIDIQDDSDMDSVIKNNEQQNWSSNLSVMIFSVFCMATTALIIFFLI